MKVRCSLKSAWWYTVHSGDSLAKIPQNEYGDGNLWSKIYKYSNNSRIIGLNPNNLRAVLNPVVVTPQPRRICRPRRRLGKKGASRLVFFVHSRFARCSQPVDWRHNCSTSWLTTLGTLFSGGRGNQSGLKIIHARTAHYKQDE
jgi:hypothetical protein